MPTIAESVKRQFGKMRNDELMRTQLEELARVQAEQNRGIGDIAWDAGAAAIGGLGAALDAPRRVVHAAGWMLAGEDAADAWDKADSSESILRAAGMESSEKSWGTWGASLALDIVTDPLTFAGIGALTKSGKAAKKAGQLATTWAGQAAKGQRAALTLWTPWKTLTVLDAPWFVRGEAALGRGLANAPVIKGLVKRFSTKSLDPRVNALVEDVMRKTGGRLESVLQWRDESLKMMKDISPEDYADVVRYAESFGRSGSSARRVLADAASWDPMKRHLGKQYHDVHETFMRVAQREGVDVGSLGAGIENKLRVLDGMESKEWAALKAAQEANILAFGNKQIAAISNAEMATRKSQALKSFGIRSHQEALDALFAAQDEAVRAGRASTYVKMRGKVEKMFRDPAAHAADIRIARESAQRAKKLDASVVGLYEQSNRAIGEASVAEADAIASRISAEGFLRQKEAFEAITPSTKKLDSITNRKAVFQSAQDELPNYISKMLSPESRQYLRKIGPLFRGDGSNMWTDKVRGLFNRKMAERIMDGKKVYLRPWSVEEIIKALSTPEPGGRLEKWNRFIQDRGGILGAIDNLFGKPKGIEKMYNLAPVDNINRLSDKLVDAIRGQEMWANLAQHEELFSRAPIDGWHHVKDISGNAVAVLGDAWVPPAMFDELRRVYTNLSNPDAKSILGKSWGTFTKAWKWSVTRMFPAYHARNHIEDTVRMLYNGAFDPIAVNKYGVKGLFRRGSMKLGQLGERNADDAWRIAEAYGIVNTGQVAVGAIRRGDGTLRAIGRGADRLFQAPEDMRRFGYWVERLNRGFSPYQAAQEVKRVLFDYSDLTHFERTVASQVIPFYTYLKNTVRLHVETAVQNPGLMLAQNRIIESLRGETPPEDIPEWARSRLFIALGPDEQTGDERLLSAYGLPLQDISELLDGKGGFKGWLKQLSWRAHPLIRFPFKVGEATVAERPAYASKVFASLPESIKDMMGVRMQKSKKTGDEYVTIDPVYSTILETVGSRFYSTAKNIGRDKTAYRATLRHIFGLNVVNYDPAQEKKRAARREFEEALARARRRGDVASIPGFYRPEGSSLSDLEYMLMQAQRKQLR